MAYQVFKVLMFAIALYPQGVIASCQTDQIHAEFVQQHSGHVLSPFDKNPIQAIKGWQITDPAKSIRLLTNKEVANEFGLSARSQNEVSKLVEKADKRRKEFRQSFLAASKRAEAKRLFEQETSSIEARIDELFSDAQMRAIEKLNERFDLRKKGPCQYLVGLEEKGLISLSKREKESIRSRASAIRKKLDGKCKKLVTTTLNTILSPLEESQKKQLDVIGYAGDSIVQVDVLLAQLDPEKIETRPIKGLFAPVEQPAFFGPGDDASPEFYVRYRQDWVACNFERAGGYLMFLDLLQNGGVKGVTLTDEQYQKVDGIRHLISSKFDQINSILETTQNPLVDAENVLDMQILLCREIDDKLEGLLTQDQMLSITDELKRLSIVKFGLLYNLGKGDIEVDPALTKLQKEEMQTSALKARKRLKSSSRKLFQDCAREYLECLGAKNRKIVKEMLGDESDSGGACLFLLFAM